MARPCLRAIQRYPCPPIPFWPLKLGKGASGVNLTEPASLMPGVCTDYPGRSTLNVPSLMSSVANE